MPSLCVIVKFPTFPIHKISITLLSFLICSDTSRLDLSANVLKKTKYQVFQPNFYCLDIMFHHIYFPEASLLILYSVILRKKIPL